jgi:mercuric ion transport protein
MEQWSEQREAVPFVRIGLIGSAIVALCCFTPFFVMLLGVLGLGAVTGYLDDVLLPALALCVGITIYGLYRKRSTMKPC